MLGSAVTEPESYTALTCPFCGLEGRSPEGLTVVMCPACQSTFDLTSTMPPPAWVSAERHRAEPEFAVLPERPRGLFGIVGALLFLIAIGIVFVGDGVNLAVAAAAPVAVVGLALIGHWGARPPYAD